MCADFHDSAVARLMAGVFEEHDRVRFAITAVSLGLERRDAMRPRLEHAFDEFLDVQQKMDREVAELLRDLQIDILVDLNGHTRGARTGILAHRPAPVQVNYLGFPGTMGAEYIDYIIGDRFVIPPNREASYHEKVVRLPDCFQANDSARSASGRTPSRRECGLPDAGFVFCCFNNSFKINPRMFDVWMRLLRRVPRSVLWILGSDSGIKSNLRHEAVARGIVPDRVVFAERIPYEEYLARYRVASLFLDTLPFNAGTTASDALWAGTPVLTCAGDAFAARMGMSLLSALDLPELITESLTHYESLAYELAIDEERFATVRSKLARNAKMCALFDTGRFCRHLETAYVAMWERHQRGEPPAGFSVGGLDSEGVAEPR